MISISEFGMLCNFSLNAGNPVLSFYKWIIIHYAGLFCHFRELLKKLIWYLFLNLASQAIFRELHKKPWFFCGFGMLCNVSWNAASERFHYASMSEHENLKNVSSKTQYICFITATSCLPLQIVFFVTPFLSSQYFQ